MRTTHLSCGRRRGRRAGVTSHLSFWTVFDTKRLNSIGTRHRRRSWFQEKNNKSLRKMPLHPLTFVIPWRRVFSPLRLRHRTSPHQSSHLLLGGFLLFRMRATFARKANFGFRTTYSAHYLSRCFPSRIVSPAPDAPMPFPAASLSPRSPYAACLLRVSARPRAFLYSQGTRSLPTTLFRSWLLPSCPPPAKARKRGRKRSSCEESACRWTSVRGPFDNIPAK